MIKINQLKLRINDDTEKLRAKVLKMLGMTDTQVKSFTIDRRSIDARKKPDILFIYTVLMETTLSNEESFVKHLGNKDVTYVEKVVYKEPRLVAKTIEGKSTSEYFSKEENRPVVVGFGPAGMFAALLLARAGMKPIIYERGSSVEDRVKDVEMLWEKGVLNKESNPQFGEGGAGTFSDGKLNTLVKDKDGRSKFVLRTFIKHGAAEDILYDSKPHVGTDHLVNIVRNIREEIISLGGEIHFNHVYHYNKEKNVILAIGHSSRDSYKEFHELGLKMEAKDFAMGFRVQHPQAMIDQALYGKVDKKSLSILGPGAYKVTHNCKNGRGVYSFCMCPGGYVVNSSSEEEKTCINGMSYHKRDSGTANAAIIVTIRKSDFNGDNDVLGGVKLQQEVEKRTYMAANGAIPVESYGDFKAEVMGNGNNRNSNNASANANANIKANTNFSNVNSSNSGNSIKPMIKGRYEKASLKNIFSFDSSSPYKSLNDFNRTFVEGMEGFTKQIRNFNRPDTILCGVESRTSSPVRIVRDEDFQGSIKGIYPCGEGAGYAGGITSAAMDGMKAAEALVKAFNSL